jgi:hypothetical protein
VEADYSPFCDDFEKVKMTVSDYYPDTSRKCWTDKLLFEVEVTTIDVYKSGADQIAWNVGSNEEQATID